MSENFVTRLERELSAAELRELTGRPALRRLRGTRHAVHGPLVAVATLTLVAVVFALLAATLSRESEVARPAPKLIRVFPVATALSSLSAGYDSVWAADPVREQVLRIDPRTDRVVARIPAGGENVVAAGAGAVWALAGDLLYRGNQGAVRLLRIDPDSNRVVARIAVDRSIAPNGLQIDGDAVWATGFEGVQRVHPAGRPVVLASSGAS